MFIRKPKNIYHIGLNAISLHKIPLFGFATKFNANKDYYTILKIPKDASNEEIKKAFQKLSILYHPNINPANYNKFNDIEEAKNVLLHQKMRKQYDKERFYVKFTDQMNNLHENRHQDTYEPKRTDHYSFQLTPEEQKAFENTKRWIKRGLIALVGIAIFFPFVYAGNSNQVQRSEPTIGGHPMRLSSFHRAQLQNQNRQQQNLSNNQIQGNPSPYGQGNPPGMIVTGRFVTD